MLKNFVACFVVPALVVLMGFVLVALSLTEQQEGAPPPLAPGVKIMSIPAAAFRPEDGANLEHYTFSNIVQYNGSMVRFIAPIILPHGSRILRIGFSYFDYGNEDITLHLWCFSDNADVFDPITVESANKSINWRKKVSPVTPVYVTTLSRAYFLRLELPDGSVYRFARAFIYYRDPL